MPPEPSPRHQPHAAGGPLLTQIRALRNHHDKLRMNAVRAPAFTYSGPCAKAAFENFPYGQQKIALAAINYHKGWCDALRAVEAMIRE